MHDVAVAVGTRLPRRTREFFTHRRRQVKLIHERANFFRGRMLRVYPYHATPFPPCHHNRESIAQGAHKVWYTVCYRAPRSVSIMGIGKWLKKAAVPRERAYTITDFAVCDDSLSLREALHLAASLESRSAHPIGRAICKQGKALPRSLGTPYEYIETRGIGVSGVVNGKRVEIGNFSYLEELAARAPSAPHDQAPAASTSKEALAPENAVVVVSMFVNKKIAAHITLALMPL